MKFGFPLLAMTIAFVSGAAVGYSFALKAPVMMPTLSCVPVAPLECTPTVIYDHDVKG